MLVGCIICNIIFISLGFYSSKDHQKDSYHDPGFWFFLQDCIIQDAGLFISVRSLWGESSGRRWLWITFTVIALTFTTISPVLYAVMPT